MPKYQQAEPACPRDTFKSGVHSVACMQLYESTRFTDGGFRHHELYFPDGSCPPEHILQQFLAISEQEPGTISFPLL